MVLGFDSREGRLEAWIAAAILSTGAAIGTGWCLNSRVPFIKMATGLGTAGLGGLAWIALEDCRDARRYQKVQRETKYQQFVAGAQAVLRNTLNYLVAAAPPPTSPQQLTALNFAALPPATPEQLPELNLQHLIRYPSVRVTGAPGAGKSRIAEEITRLRCEAGYQAIAIDPHAEYGQWEGLKVIGKGQNYQEIQDWITWFIGEVKERYRRRATEPNYNPPALTIICEELTGWKRNKVKNASDLEIIGLSDTRKINIAITFVSHGKTSDLMGGAKGMAKTRELGYADLDLFVQIDDRTGDAVPKLEAILKLPSQEPQRVRVPTLAPLPPGTFRKFGEKAAIAPSISPTAGGDNVQNRLPLEKLEKSYSSELAEDAISPDEWEIIEIGIKKGGTLTIREIQRSAPGRRLKLSAVNCEAMFERWAEFGIGEIVYPNGKQIQFKLHEN